MDENHQDKTGSKLITTEGKLWHPPLSPKDQQKLDRLRRKAKKSGSNWIGFANRTLWDWLQFFAVLAIPIIVAAGTLYFTQQITLQQAQLSILTNEHQHQTDIQIAADQQQEMTLENYFDRMTDFLLTHGLRQSSPGDEVRNVARVRTLTTLRLLNGDRKGLLIRFLYQAQLINTSKGGSDHNNPIISLDNADLSGLHLIGPNLQFSERNMIEHIYCSHPTSLDLRGAGLSGADLRACLNGVL